MDARNATRIGIAIGIAAAIVAAAVIAAFLLSGDSDSNDIQPLAVESWNVESGSYYPHYWINVSEDLREGLLYGHSGTDVTLQLFNHSSGVRKLTTSGGSRIDYGPVTMIHGTLNLQGFDAGVFVIHAFVNATTGGGPNPIVEKRFEDAMEITLPAERPPVPLVTQVSVTYNATTSLWHYTVEMVDPDADCDTLDVYLSDKEGFTKYHARVNNTLNATAWSYEADINVTLSHRQYNLSAQVTDRDGPYSTEWIVPIYP